MSKQANNLQGSKYDKILRENMPLAMPGIMKNVLGLNIVAVQELKDKIQITRQKEVDVLRIVTDAKGKEYILQVEFESKNNRKMHYRVCEYRCMLHQIYNYPIKQYVIYMGKARSSTPNRIDLPGLQFEYTLISISNRSYKLFLSSKEPEEQILTVLANFEDDDPTEVIKDLLIKLKGSSGELTDNKYYEQLRVLLQMRNLDNYKDKAMELVDTFFKKERDTLYKWGVRDAHAKADAKAEAKIAKAQKKAEQEKIEMAWQKDREFAVKLKLKSMPLDEIAELTGLSIEEIEAL